MQADGRAELMLRSLLASLIVLLAFAWSYDPKSDVEGKARELARVAKKHKVAKG